MKLLIALLFSLAPLSANAVIHIVSVTGVSRADPITSLTTTLNVYGGQAGNNRCSGGTTTCNSCTTAAVNETCNEQAINSSTYLTITFNSDSVDNGFPSIFPASTTTTGTNLNISTTKDTPVPKLTNGTIQVPWGTLCQNFGGTASDSSCSQGSPATIGVGTFTIGMSSTDGIAPTDTATITVTSVPDSPAATFSTTAADCRNNPGSGTTNIICNYVAYPGDQKVTVQSLQANGNFPTDVNSVKFSAVRLYFIETSYTDAVVAAADGTNLEANFFAQISPQMGSAEIPVSATATASNPAFDSDGRVTGLDNDKVYAFKLAHVDAAGNIGLFTDAASDAVCETGASYSCHIAQPGAVLGVLSKTLNCFIATAAYGSPFASKVQTFRDFRDRYLMTNPTGRAFIATYYKYGPYAARLIADKPSLRAATRVVLFPLWLMAWLSLKMGGLAVTLILFTIAGSVFYFARSFRARRRQGLAA